VAEHLRSVIGRAGRVDVSFNAVGVPNAGLLGVPLAELDAGRFAEPITAYTTSYFLTARLAARHMIPNGSGVIMTVSALPARKGTPLNGGYGAAQAAKEALTRDLSAELAPQGIRVVALRPHGMPETRTMAEAFEAHAKPSGMSWGQFQGYLASTTHPRRVMTLGEMANVAVFVASDKASGLTGTTVNLTMGSLDDLAWVTPEMALGDGRPSGTGPGPVRQSWAALRKAATEAEGHFGLFAFFASMDVPASAALTQKQFGWHPAHPGLILDLDEGHYFGIV
jgi:NAD(P)-dependent dehydrogenase (short-subunit alcohol dehydrogenase family)